MNRYGYSDDWCDSREEQWALIRWRGAVNSAIRGKRGQAFLKELLTALDRMPVKQLVEGDLVNADGEHCALGVVLETRKIDPVPIMDELDDDEWGDAEPYWDHLSHSLGIAGALAREIMFMNDEGYFGPISKPKGFKGSDEAWDVHVKTRRWGIVRNWVASQLKGTGGVDFA